MNRGIVSLVLRDRLLLLIALLSLCLPYRMVSSERYHLHASFSGQAQGTFLLIFRYRVYYEAAADLQLNADKDDNGGQVFRLKSVSAPAYVMRTLGFSGRALAIMTAFTDYNQGNLFAKKRVVDWEKECPEYAKYIRKVKRLPFLVENVAPQSWTFQRSSAGVVGDGQSQLKLHYKHHPQEIGIYFQVYALISEMLACYNHGVWPDSAAEPPVQFPVSWLSGPIDLTNILTRVGAQTEKIVASAVTFDQEQPFVMEYTLLRQDGDELEIIGRNKSRPGIWKSFDLHLYERRVILRKRDLLPLRDEIHLLIENGKGQRGRGKLLLEYQTS